MTSGKASDPRERERGAQAFGAGHAARAGDAGGGERLAHRVLAAEARELGRAKARHVEVVAEPGLGLEPVLADRVEPIERSVPRDEASHRVAEHAVVAHLRRKGVLAKRRRELGAKARGGRVADRHDGRAARAERGAEVVRVGRKPRRQEQDGHRRRRWKAAAFQSRNGVSSLRTTHSPAASPRARTSRASSPRDRPYA